MSSTYYYELETANNKVITGIFNAASDKEALEIMSYDVNEYKSIFIQNVDNEPYSIFDTESILSIH